MANKNHRASASQFFIAGELCRRGHAAVVTMGNTPNTDILVSNADGTRFVHIQVKTYVPNPKGCTCSVGKKAERDYGPNFFWILGGIQQQGQEANFDYYIIPSSVMAKYMREGHQNWLNKLGKNGRPHEDHDMRFVFIPPKPDDRSGFDITPYLNAWHLIDALLSTDENCAQ